MAAVMTCDAMGWTYQEYCNQPKWFIDLLSRKRAADKERSDGQSK